MKDLNQGHRLKFFRILNEEDSAEQLRQFSL